jgi:hypothetical protein
MPGMRVRPALRISWRRDHSCLKAWQRSTLAADRAGMKAAPAPAASKTKQTVLEMKFEGDIISRWPANVAELVAQEGIDDEHGASP